jgi:GDP-mannose 6-dehydrogenase
MQKIHNITVFGLGYVGCVSSACLAELGHQVCGVDRDAHKTESVNRGEAPFHEPGLGEMVARNVAAGRLRAATSAAEGLRDADLALLCVGTPSERNGNLDLEQLRRVMAEIATLVAGRERPLIVAVRSTVFPGTCEEVVLPALAGLENVHVVSNPEFLREGTAVRDFLQPSLLVVGGQHRASMEAVAEVYAGLPVEACLVTLRTAEMIKYACNAFHALKVGFANEIGSLSAQLGVPAGEVMATLCRDTKLNISTAYLKPGFAFGGSCLPKDLRALTYRAARLDLDLPMLGAVLPSNAAHLRRAVQTILDLPSRRTGILGLTFKEDTDDLRESPVVGLLETLIGKGRDVRIFDPHIQMTSIYGANREYLLNAIPHISRLLQGDPGEVLSWADHLVVTQKLSPALAAQVASSGLPVTDLSGAWLG